MNQTLGKTLVLNQGYEPLMVVSWKRAFMLVWLEKAEAVVAYPHKIRSAAAEFVVPAVVRLVHRVRNYRRGTSFSRRTLYERDDHTCQYCGVRKRREKLTMDHVHPKSRGGHKNWENIVTSCLRCNNIKGNRTPVEAKMPLMRKPRKPVLRKSETSPKEWGPYLWG